MQKNNAQQSAGGCQELVHEQLVDGCQAAKDHGHRLRVHGKTCPWVQSPAQKARFKDLEMFLEQKFAPSMQEVDALKAAYAKGAGSRSTMGRKMRETVPQRTTDLILKLKALCFDLIMSGVDDQTMCSICFVRLKKFNLDKYFDDSFHSSDSINCAQPSSPGFSKIIQHSNLTSKLGLVLQDEPTKSDCPDCKELQETLNAVRNCNLELVQASLRKDMLIYELQTKEKHLKADLARRDAPTLFKPRRC